MKSQEIEQYLAELGAELKSPAGPKVLDRYVLPDGQKDEAETIEYSLHVLFGPESESKQ